MVNKTFPYGEMAEERENIALGKPERRSRSAYVSAVLETDETRAGLLKKEQEAGGKTWMLKPDSLTFSFGITLRNPNLTMEHEELGFCGIPELTYTRGKILGLSEESRSAEPEHLGKVVEKELPGTGCVRGGQKR